MIVVEDLGTSLFWGGRCVHISFQRKKHEHFKTVLFEGWKNGFLCNISGTCDPSSGKTRHGRFPVVTVTILMGQISHCFTKQDAGILKDLKKA